MPRFPPFFLIVVAIPARAVAERKQKAAASPVAASPAKLATSPSRVRVTSPASEERSRFARVQPVDVDSGDVVTMQSLRGGFDAESVSAVIGSPATEARSTVKKRPSAARSGAYEAKA